MTKPHICKRGVLWYVMYQGNCRPATDIKAALWLAKSWWITANRFQAY